MLLLVSVLFHRVGVEDDESGQLHEEVSGFLFIVLLRLLKQGQVIPYDKTKGNWLIAKFSNIDKE